MNTKTVFPRTHISLHVKSIGRTMEFYDKFFHTSPAKVEEKYVKYELDHPALTISFVEQASEVLPTFGHLGIQVKTKQELNEKLNLARGHKIVQLEETETTCCYAVQDKYWVKDPDGYEWEVYYFIADDQKMGGRDEQDSPCCTPEDKKEKSVCC